MSMSVILTAVLVFSAVVFGTLSLALVWEVLQDWLTEREVGKRLHPVLTGESQSYELQDDLLRQLESTGGFFAHLAQALPGLDRTDKLMQEARLEWRADTFLLISTGVAAGCGTAAFLISNQLFAGALAAAIGAAMPYLYVRRKRKMRLARFEEELPEAIDLLTRAIRAGHPLTSGMQMVANEGPPTVAVEFRQVFEEQRYGLPFEDALLGMVDRVTLLDVRIFAVAILIQREVGGNLAEILNNLADTIRKRFYIRRQLRTYTAQGRMSGYTLFALPIVVGLLTYLIEPEHIGLLFTTTAGWFMVITAIVLQLIGGLWIRKIVDIEI
ncbi:MAG: type II secretion system F family protein [Longimicrobiales bacterium]|nr:type II secretion system F family protein [Longimicrobiales bacterium]